MSVPLVLFGGLQLATSDCKPSTATGVAGANITRDCTALGARVKNKPTRIELHARTRSLILYFIAILIAGIRIYTS